MNSGRKPLLIVIRLAGPSIDKPSVAWSSMKTAPADKKVMPVGQWNHARILSKDKQLTYWLNGVKTIDIERGSKEWRDLVTMSKYKVWPNFGELPEGHILLQDHGDEVWFRNLKIRRL